MENIEKRIKEKFNNAENNDIQFPRKNLLIEVTNKCNNRCIFCANRRMTRKKGIINPELAKKILRDCYLEGTREVGFYATGEPLLYPHLKELILYARELGYEYIYLTTNGLLANKMTIEELLISGLNSIKFSINAINRRDYEFIHGVDAFEVVMNNLKDCHKLKSLYNFNLFVSCIETRFTKYSENEVKKFFLEYCDKVVIQYAKNQGGYLPSVLHFLACSEDQTSFNLPCYYVLNSITISCEGYLTCCCMDFQNYLAYADLNTTQIKEAWRNSIISDFREKHKKGKIINTLCDSCINNRYDSIIPLSENLATIIKDDFFHKDIELDNRVKQFKKEKQE